MQCKPQNHVEENGLLSCVNVCTTVLYKLCGGLSGCLTHTKIPWHPCSRRSFFQPMSTTRLRWGCAATSEKTFSSERPLNTRETSSVLGLLKGMIDPIIHWIVRIGVWLLSTITCTFITYVAIYESFLVTFCIDYASVTFQ